MSHGKEESKPSVTKGEVLAMMTEARRRLIEKHPFIGSLALRLKLIPTDDGRLDSATTDGSRSTMPRSLT